MTAHIYNICHECYQIESVFSWGRNATDHLKCIHCNAENKNGVWPSSEITELLAFIRNYPAGSTEYGNVTSVFTSSILELMLEELVTKVAYEDLSYEQGSTLIDALLDAYQGRSRLLALYKRVGYGTFQEAVRHLGYVEFLANWDAIVAVRNKVVHGKLKRADQITHSLINKTLDDAIPVFQLLHNRYNEESFEYKYATKSKLEVSD